MKLNLSKVAHLNPHIKKIVKTRSDTSSYKAGNKEKMYIKTTLDKFCKEHNLILVEELKFLTDRKFKFDYAIEEIKLAVEYEGIKSKKSRHTTLTGYSTDSTKYNLAGLDGWTILRYTTLTYKNIDKNLTNIKLDK